MSEESRPKAAHQTPAKASDPILPETPGIGSAARFQPMPELSPEQYEALKADIAARGVVVPVVLDQYGRTLDGHNRQRIAAELGIDCPTEVRHVADDDEAADLAVTLNCARRHLTREQVRVVIRAEVVRRPEDSDRAIARRAGCSPSTVGAVRRGSGGELPQVSKLDSPSREEAEARVEEIREHLRLVRESVYSLVDYGLSNGIPPADLVLSLTRAQRAVAPPAGMDEDDGAAAVAVFRRQVFEPLIDYAMDPKVYEYWRSEWDGVPEFLPLSEQETVELLDGIATISGGRVR